MIHISICDDEKIIMQKIQTIIHTTLSAQKRGVEISCYENANEFIQHIIRNREEVDILILDISMPNCNGMQLAKMLREQERNVILIFCSSHDDYVFHSFTYQAFRFVRKCYLDTELPVAIRAAIQAYDANAHDFIILKTNNGETRINLQQLVYYEKQDRKVIVHLKDNTALQISKTIKEMQLLITDSCFVQLHSGCVVNTQYIQNVSDFDVTITDGTHLIMSRYKSKQIRDKILQHWGDTM